MAQAPHRPASQSHSQQQGQQRQHQQEQRREPERHPAQGPPARPGVPQRDQQQRPEAEPEAPPEKILEKDEALALFRAGHRLKKAGDPPNKWIAASRIHGVMVLCYPMDEEIEKGIMEQELVLADDLPQS
jgi:hypothetical protein